VRHLASLVCVAGLGLSLSVGGSPQAGAKFISPKMATLATAAGSRGCTVVGTPAFDDLVGTDGDDIICGFGGKDLIDGKAGDDVIFGGHGEDNLAGGAGADRIYGGRDDDRLFGEAQNDVLRGEGARTASRVDTETMSCSPGAGLTWINTAALGPTAIRVVPGATRSPTSKGRM
jgi:Ca2+-binding RTX toxin-like protein